MEKETFVVIFLTLLASGSGKVFIFPEPGEYSDYPRNCSRIKDFASEPVVKEISSYLLQNNVSSVWLPVRRKRLNAWIWLNNSTYATSVSDPGWAIEGHDCAFLRAGDKIIDYSSCNRNLSHFICETTGKNCSDIIDGFHCWKHRQKSYVIYSKQKYTWYMAKQHCFEQDMTLASFEAKDSREVMEKIATELGYYQNVWIGLRQAEYMTEYTYNEYTYRNLFHWAPGSPCVCHYMECAVITHGAWRAQNCTSVHHFICYDPGTDEGKERKREQSTTNQGETDKKVAITVPLVLFASIITTLIVVAVLYKRKQMSNNRGELEENNQMINKKEKVRLTSTARRIRNEILKPNKLNKENINILVIGLPGTGKSSLMNSLIAALDKDGFREWFRAGKYGDFGVSGKGQLTKKLRHFTLFQTCYENNEDLRLEKREEESYRCKPTLWDCPGLMNDASEKTANVLNLILRGALDEDVHVNDLLKMEDEEKLQNIFKQLKEDKNRAIDVILFVHAAEYKELPGNLLRVTDRQVDGNEGRREIPVIFVLNKKDISKSKKERKAIIDEASKKLGLTGSDNRVFIVSSYSEQTMAKNKNRNIKIDKKMCQIWCKILSPEMYTLR